MLISMISRSWDSPDHVVRDAARPAETGAGDDGDRFVCAVEPKPDPTLKGVNEVRVHVVPVPTRLFAERLDGADVLAADAATRRFRPSTGLPRSAPARPQGALRSLRAVGRHEDPYGLAQKSPVFPGIRHLELQQSAEVPGAQEYRQEQVRCLKRVPH